MESPIIKTTKLYGKFRFDNVNYGVITISSHKETTMNSGAGCTTKKVSQVTTQLESLDNNINRLNDSVRTLEDKLIGCLLLPPPVPTEVLKDSDELVPIASDIRRFANLVRYATDHIVDITNRLEI